MREKIKNRGKQEGNKIKWPQAVSGEVQMGRFSLGEFSIESIIKHWNGLLREVVESPFLGVVKNQLDIALVAMG